MASTVTRELGAAPPRLPRTIWYMGVKARILPGFLGPVLEEEAPAGSTVVDLMTGTGVVAAYCASRFRVIANDTADYSHVIARSLIEHDPASKEGFARALDPERDLQPAYRRNHAALEQAYAGPLEREAALLERHEHGEHGAAWCRDYRSFLEEPGAVYGSRPCRGGRGSSPGAAALTSEEAITARREDPRLRPACLVTAYYANIYFGLRQSVEIDSLRAAIDEIDGRDPFREAKRVHYLSALIHAASISTSGTSHFAQPRHLGKLSELRAMARRRSRSIRGAFEEFSREILETVLSIRHVPGNHALHGDYGRFIEGTDGARGKPARLRFNFPSRPELIYLDPPYTSDHYSRFYHVLDALARHDYPPLEKDSKGEVLRGRYPALERRFQSGFSSRPRVEDEFRRVIEASAGCGAKLVISYSWPSGLLLKEYAAQPGRGDPVRGLEDLCREGYRSVRTLRCPLRHSGQGDSSIEIEELLVVCAEPRGA